VTRHTVLTARANIAAIHRLWSLRFPIPDAPPRAAPAAVALFAQTEPDINWTPLLSHQFADFDFLSEQIAIVRDIAKQSEQI
jgi:hypothetical protein